MRVAVSGSHGTGKSTLIAAFLARRPEYAHEPEAFETVGDDVDLSGSEGPTPDGLHRLLAFTAESLAARASCADVVHERSPVDYLAYAAVSRRWWGADEVSRFLQVHVPIVRACLGHLDVIALLPASGAGRPDEDERFRRRVDEHIRRALIDDEYDVFGDRHSPRVVELPARPDRRLPELLRLVDGTARA